MDLAYLRANPTQLPTLLRHQRIRETPVAGGDIADARRLTLDDGSSVFVKSLPEPVPPGFFAAEAAGLRWLGEAADGVPVPEVIAQLDTMIVIEWVDGGEPSPHQAEEFGRALAATHRAGAAAFGADWPGYIGKLPLDNAPSPGPWAAWFAERRLLPYLRTSRDTGALSTEDVTLIEDTLTHIDGYGDEPPSRIHGDLWPGNVHWTADGQARLVDPAAHGGHRETDLALLGLFGGAPYLDRILAAYDEAWPLAEGWRDRVALHQLYLLLVHTATFGAAYRDAVMHAVRATVKG